MEVQDRPVDADGEKQDDAGGAQKTEDGQRVGAEHTGQTEYRAQGNAEGRAARDAESIRLNQRVPEHGLKHDSGKTEAPADGEAEKNPREAYIEKDGVVGSCPLPPNRRRSIVPGRMPEGPRQREKADTASRITIRTSRVKNHLKSLFSKLFLL